MCVGYELNDYFFCRLIIFFIEFAFTGMNEIPDGRNSHGRSISSLEQN